MIDEWVEVMPRVDGKTTVGVAVNANGPNARAPQSLLLAVNPDDKPWTPQKVFDMFDDVARSARQRPITFETLPLAARLLPATYVADWSLQDEPSMRILSLADPDAAADRWLSHVRDEDDT